MSCHVNGKLHFLLSYILDNVSDFHCVHGCGTEAEMGGGDTGAAGISVLRMFMTLCSKLIETADEQNNVCRGFAIDSQMTMGAAFSSNLEKIRLRAAIVDYETHP